MKRRIINFLRCKWFSDLTTNNNGKSSKSWFLVVVTLVGVFLLIIPGIVLMIEVINNHTITTDLSGLAAYIGAISTLFVTVGATKVLGEKYEHNHRNELDDHHEDLDYDDHEPRHPMNNRKFSM